MSVDWTHDERTRVEEAIRRHPVESGRCAAVARVVVAVGRERDDRARGLHVRPRSPARYVVPKLSRPPRWGTHTFGEAHVHAIDALTGADGCPASRYLDEHWEYADQLELIELDVEQVDPGIQDAP